MSSSIFFLQQALTDSLTSGVFIDTKFYAFSRRRASGHVGEPKALYANGHVLKQIPYFEDLLFGTFSEATTTNLRAGFPENKDHYRDDYEYSSDSDLEDELPEVHDPDDGETSTVEEVSSEDSLPFFPNNEMPDLQRDPFEMDIFPHDHAGDDELRMSDIFLQSEAASGSDDPPQDILEGKYETTEAGEELSTGSVHLGKVVIIKDAAFSTFQSLLLYLYTGEIEFAPFGSDANRRLRTAENPVQDFKRMPKASPKSIYRLADKYDIPDLKRLAFDNICANLATCDIVDELFCEFTSCYPEIRDAAVQQLATVLLSSNPKETAELLDKKIQSYAEGELPHSSEAFTSLFDVLSDENSTPKTNVIPTAPTMNTLPHWVNLKAALKKSLTTGTFLDLRYYANSSWSSSRIDIRPRPIYFSRMMVDGWFGKIEACANKLEAKLDDMTVSSETQGDYEYDSDLEDEDEPHARDERRDKAVVSVDSQDQISGYGIPENPSTKENSEITMLFKIGTATTWKALFFWVYTNEVSFAPLCSQGLQARIDWIKERQTQFPHQPRPCSPKSLYTLANKLDLGPLRDLAFKDIETKMLAANVVTELFSRFTSSQETILAMQNKALGEKFRNSETIDMVKENIKTMSKGNASHRSKALKSVFRSIVARKPLVDLQCNSYCRRAHPMSSLRQGLWCPIYASNSYYVFCASCRWQRNAITNTCLNCQARFKD